MRYVNVTTVDDIYQAQFVSHALEEEGIPCIQANEATNSMLPYLRQGIQIRVKETDYLRAKVICDRAAEMRLVRCPNCDSSHIKYVDAEVRDLRWWEALILILNTLTFTAPIKKYALIYNCTVCGTTFKKD